ncbi:MAG: type IV pilus biogenesis/stability protein PilW [Gammaproteobacteria bacterium]|nr:type IV pilus biogenesis/stability protein PilW [Gammaproteobacteria bacterium]
MNITKLLPLLLLIFLVSCNQSGKKKSDLRPTAGTNKAAMANLNLGIEYMRIGEYEKSLEKLDRARAADPDFSGTYNAYGLLYQAIERPDDAEKSFKKALKLNPSDSNTMNNYGRFLCEIDRSEEAEAILLRAAANPLYSTPEIAITNAGSCAFKKDRLADAERYFRQAIELNERNPTALLQMSQLSFDQKKHLSARAYLQRYLSVSRHNAASLWLGIQIENILGDKDALSSYKLSLKNNFPDSDEAQRLGKSGSGS